MILLPYPPSTNRYWRNYQGRIVISTEGKAFKSTASWLCKAGGMKILSGDVELTVMLHPKKNKNGTASKTRIDLDNALKCTCDALNGVGYDDDGQIVRIVAEVGSALKDGGVSVTVKGMNR